MDDLQLANRIDALDTATVPDWIKQRIGKFTASEIWKLFVPPKKKDALIGETALGYIKQKAAEILTGEPTPEVQARAIEYGNQNEKDAYLWYRDHFRNGCNSEGLLFDTCEDLIYHGIENPRFIPYGDHAGGSVDGFIGKDGIFGIKCPWNSNVHLEYMMMKSSCELPREYLIQAQCELKFTGRSYFHFISYNPRMLDPKHRMTLVQVLPDPDMFEQIDEKIEQASEILISIIDSL